MVSSPEVLKTCVIGTEKRSVRVSKQDSSESQKKLNCTTTTDN